MTDITKEKLNEILLNRQEWLNKEEDGIYANLIGANLSNTDLSDTDLSYANLIGANLRNADLTGADLSNTDLSSADLSSADLSYADLRSADLSYADLSNADLSNADLSYANLIGAKFDENEKVRFGYIVDKPFLAYKKGDDGEIITLKILKGSIVFSINNNKCRTNRAKVIAIDGDKTIGLKAHSMCNSSFIYEVGKIVKVEDFNLQYNVECAEGIHFFRTKEAAQDYCY